MTLKVTGKNIETSPAFQDYVVDKVDEVLQKYIGPEIGGHIRVEKERGRFRTACSIRLRTGLLLEAEGHGADAYASADQAVEHLDKRVRRYKRRLKNHHHSANQYTLPAEDGAPDYVVTLSDTDAVEVDPSPVIVAEAAREFRELAVSEAVLQLDLIDQPFLLFRNAAHGGVNIVYRRADGNIGWIDPGPAKPASGGADRSLG
jgi:ribosomal subunit interface protein